MHSNPHKFEFLKHEASKSHLLSVLKITNRKMWTRWCIWLVFVWGNGSIPRLFDYIRTTLHSQWSDLSRSLIIIMLVGTWGIWFALIPQEWFPIYFAKETCAKCYNFNKSDKTEQATFLLRGLLNSTHIKISNNIPKRIFNTDISMLWIKTQQTFHP